MPDLYQFATPAGRCRRRRCQVRRDRPDFEDARRTARSTGRLPPAIGSCSGSAIPCWESPTIRRPPEATGLEVDKLNRSYVKNYMDTYLDSYKETVGAD